MKEEKFKGNPVYWKSENGLCVITYDQFAIQNKYKLYFNKTYANCDDSLRKLVDYAKKSSWYRE